MSKTVFITGGTGYIGSHCIVDLLNAGYNVITIDNLTNSRSGVIKRIKHITGKFVTFYKCDLLDGETIEKVFAKHKIDFVIHFAAMKAVEESMKFPLSYYRNNVIGTINLLEAMKNHDVFNLVFSSSCTVYGNPEHLPITEEHPVGNITNVYGRTKFLIEEMLKDLSHAESRWNIISLRYFNPVGAHLSGHIGEDPTKELTNLMPFIGQVAIKNKPFLTVFGTDYDTDDGSGVRDYIHVMDLASGHVAALSKLQEVHLKYKTYNLGTGEGISVLQLVKAFERVTKTTIPIVERPRREGDIVAIYANANLAKKELNWSAQYTLEDMCQDFWRFQTMNPNGYADDELVTPCSLESTVISTAKDITVMGLAANGLQANESPVINNGESTTKLIRNMKTVLVTGGTGYIGSHCIVQFLNEGYEVITIDNAINSRTAVLRRVETLTGKKVIFCLCDLCDKASLAKVFDQYTIDIVVHCASFKNVSESISNPFDYYKNNLISSINLFDVMKENNVFQLLFSSSCSVYGNPEVLPITELHPIGNNITNTYGRTKYFIEQILIDITKADKRWNVISLRYFNPIGAHPSGKIGEDNVKSYTNLLPCVAKVAAGIVERLNIYGSDYNTSDGSAVRDYIHIMDLADGHVLAVNKMEKEHLKYKVYNLGLGKGVTTLDVVKAYETASGKKVNYTVTERRAGDVECLICDGSLASLELGWTPKRGIEEMCGDFYRWQSQNPFGYSQDPPFESTI